MKNPQESWPSGTLGRMLQRLPGGRRVQRRLQKIRHRVLEAIDAQRDDGDVAPPPASHVPYSSLSLPTLTPGEMLRQLLTASQEQSREQAESLFFHTVLRSLTPDQARILAALSGGSTYALIHVMAGSRLGLGMRPVLECITTVGKNAGVSCPDLTPVYVQGLMAWGLVEIESTALPDFLPYEMLETDTRVRATVDRLKQTGQGNRIVRRTLRMSPLGERLWTTCQFPEA